ncbi:MAG TPA: heavy-metal-associated domain-containing protein [Chitinophagaceae bacterium]
MRTLLLMIAMAFMTVSAQAQFTKATLQATGLTCAMCSKAINNALQAVPFIESVKSDIKNSAFNIVFKSGATVDIDAIKNAVEDAGFSVGSLKLTGNFNEMKVTNDEHVQIGNTSFHFLDVKDQVLNGERSITVVDKNFVTAKQFKKISSSTKMSCVQTGKAASCCTKEGVPANARIYHVTI